MAKLKNLCGPNGRCSHACHQGSDCRGSQIASAAALWMQPITAADLAAGQRAMHVEDGGTWITHSHRVLRLRPEAEPEPAASSPHWAAITGAIAGFLAACILAAACMGVQIHF